MGNSKLGRLRLDTLRDIEEQKRKDAKRKRANLSSAFDTDGDKVLMVSKYDGFCAVCRNRYKEGQFIWYDHTKPKGKKAAHRDCYQKKGH